MTNWRDRRDVSVERQERCVSGEMPVNIAHLQNSAPSVPSGRKWHF